LLFRRFWDVHCALKANVAPVLPTRNPAQQRDAAPGEVGSGSGGRRLDETASVGRILLQERCAATVLIPTGADAEPRPGQTDQENCPKVRRELTGKAGRTRAQSRPRPGSERPTAW
jgi:hypothetical protein